MTFAEIIPYLFLGKKLKRSIFDENEYIILDEEGILMHIIYNASFQEDEKCSYEINSSDLKAVDWRVVE